jgi:hypothetical protein
VKLQRQLLTKTSPVYYRDLAADQPGFKAMQYFRVHGFFPLGKQSLSAGASVRRSRGSKLG